MWQYENQQTNKKSRKTKKKNKKAILSKKMTMSTADSSEAVKYNKMLACICFLIELWRCQLILLPLGMFTARCNLVKCWNCFALVTLSLLFLYFA